MKDKIVVSTRQLLFLQRLHYDDVYRIAGFARGYLSDSRYFADVLGLPWVSGSRPDLNPYYGPPRKF
jgi:hypothetical protein